MPATVCTRLPHLPCYRVNDWTNRALYMVLDDFGDLVPFHLDQMAKSMAEAIADDFYKKWPIPEGMMEVQGPRGTELRRIDYYRRGTMNRRTTALAQAIPDMAPNERCDHMLDGKCIVYEVPHGF